MLDEKGFNQWAEKYDTSIRNEKDYPFAGYTDLMNAVIHEMDIKEGTTICDVGIGTGILSRYLAEIGANITGIDFSGNMLEIARKRIPSGTFYKRDIKPGFLNDENYQYIISNYVMHHFTLDEKVRLIKEMVSHLLPKGKLIIGDIAFKNEEELLLCKEKSGQAWDDDEFYLIEKDLKSRLENIGIKMKYQQISFCCGMFVINTDL